MFVSIVVFLLGSVAARGMDAAQRLREADDLLNSRYGSLQSYRDPAEKIALRDMQRAWIRYRDRQCRVEALLARPAANDGGDGALPEPSVECLARVTDQQRILLESYLAKKQQASLAIAGFGTSYGPPDCVPLALRGEYTVLAVGVHEGAFDTDIQLDEPGHRTKRVDVVVKRPDERLVLVLMAYDPVVWNVTSTERSEIALVIVGGYHSQVVTGLAASTPLMMSTATGRRDCREIFHAYSDRGSDFADANAFVRMLTGKPIEDMQYAYAGGRFVIESAAE